MDRLSNRNSSLRTGLDCAHLQYLSRSGGSEGGSRSDPSWTVSEQESANVKRIIALDLLDAPNPETSTKEWCSISTRALETARNCVFQRSRASSRDPPRTRPLEASLHPRLGLRNPRFRLRFWMFGVVLVHSGGSRTLQEGQGRSRTRVEKVI